MSERKVLNKYYPPDFDPSKIPRMKLPKNRQYTVRLMAPFNMRCVTCGEYIYKGKKFNARKEDVENQDYLGIRIYRFYIKCTRCLQEISFKTDPKNTDYEIEAGATRNFMALKLAEEQAVREEEEAKEEEANNPMKLLENRTKQSKNEIELLESLEELKDLNKRQETVDYDSMLLSYDPSISAREREERLQQLDEEYIKTVKFHSTQKRKIVVEEEIIEENEPEEKVVKLEEAAPGPSSSATSDTTADIVSSVSTKNNKLIKPLVISTQKKVLSGLVKIKNPSAKDESPIGNKGVQQTVENVRHQSTLHVASKDKPRLEAASPVQVTQQKNGLALLGAYSDSDSNESD